MNQQDLKAKLAHPAADIPARSRFCPAPATLAAWFDDRLPDGQRATLQRHLADCDHCQAQLGMLQHLRDTSGDIGIGGDTLAAARQMGQRRRRRGAAPYWASAAVIVLAVSLLLLNRDPAFSPPAGTPAKDEFRQTRSLGAEMHRPRLLQPTADTPVDPQRLTIRWTPVADSLYYDLTVMSDAGDLVLQTRLQGTEWTGADELALEPGMPYFVRVEALLANARSVSSDHVLFTTSGVRREP